MVSLALEEVVQKNFKVLKNFQKNKKKNSQNSLARAIRLKLGTIIEECMLRLMHILKKLFSKFFLIVSG
jgi:hypothetical protein